MRRRSHDTRRARVDELRAIAMRLAKIDGELRARLAGAELNVHLNDAVSQLRYAQVELCAAAEHLKRVPARLLDTNRRNHAER